MTGLESPMLESPLVMQSAVRDTAVFLLLAERLQMISVLLRFPLKLNDFFCRLEGVVLILYPLFANELFNFLAEFGD